MSSEQTAQLALIMYGLGVAAIVAWRALRCPAGWRLWLLYGLNAGYMRIFFHWRANRRCPFDQIGPAIIIANHRSPVDPQIIMAGMRSCRPLGFLTAREYCEIRALRFIVNSMESIPVERDGRDMAATRAALRRLRAGKLLGVFPEGRINTGDGLLPGNPGVAWLALQSQAPVFPVFIHNAPQGASMVAAYYKFRRVRLTYGDPIDLSAYHARGLGPEVIDEVLNLMMARLAALGGVRRDAVLPPSPAAQSRTESERGWPGSRHNMSATATGCPLTETRNVGH